MRQSPSVEPNPLGPAYLLGLCLLSANLLCETMGSGAGGAQPMRVRKLAGRKGGKSRSRKKLAAVRRNLERARAKRWAKKGGVK